MTVIRPNSISGITSITAQANEINFFRSNGTLAGLQLNGVNFNTTTGVSTFSNLNVGGVLTYQDVTNVDSVGVITARSNIDCNGDLDVDGHTNLDNVSIVGVTTFNGLSSNDVIRVRSADSNGNSVVNILSEGTTGNSRILFSDTAATSGDGWISYSHNDRALTFTTAGTSNERLRITSSGTIGIGTDNPVSGAAGARLAVHFDDNTSYAGGTARGNGIIVYNRNAGGHSSLELAQRNSANTYGTVILNAVDPADGNNYGADFTIQTRATGSGNYGERLRIDASGRVLIGTTTPYSGANMEIRSTDSGGDTQLRITNNATGANTKAGIVFTTSTGDYASGSIRYERDAGLAQGSGGNMGTYDALVLTAWSYGSANPWSGNTQNGMYLWGQSGTGAGGFNQAIGIGTDIPPQNTNGASGNSNGPALFCTAEGGNAITLLGRTPTPAGNDDIVGINFAARNYFGTTGRSGLTYQIVCQNGHGSYGDRGQLRFNPGYNGNSNNDGKGMVMEFQGHFRPTHDNAQNLGSGSLRWSTVYAATTSINNSDINLKQNIAGLSDAEMKAASRISKIFKTYRWKESVEEKGDDKARIHTGVIAQTVKTELEAEGLDPSKYAFYCQDTGWYKDGVLLGDGITHGPGVYDKLNDETPSTVGFTSTTTYAIRYVELLSFLAAYNEQRFTSIESRLTALEGS